MSIPIPECNRFHVTLLLQHLKGKTPSSYSEMACDACMKSHDFLRMYQQRVQPVRVVKGEGRGGEDITIESPSPEKASPEKASTSAVSSCKEGGCELERRRGRLVMMGGCEDGAGYFDDNWREQLCRCSKCMVRNTRELKACKERKSYSENKKKELPLVPVLPSRSCTRCRDVASSWSRGTRWQRTRRGVLLDPLRTTQVWQHWLPRSTAYSKWRCCTVRAMYLKP